MEWKYEFTNDKSSIADCLNNWKKIVTIPHPEKYIIIFDIRKANNFNVKGILQLTAFIALNKKKIKAQTEKVRIMLDSIEQENSIKRGLRLSPYLVEFEIINTLENKVEHYNNNPF